MKVHIQLTRARSPSKAKALCRTSEASSTQQCRSRSLREHCATCKIVYIKIISKTHTKGTLEDRIAINSKSYIQRGRTGFSEARYNKRT